MDRSSDTPVNSASIEEAAPKARTTGGDGPRLVADNRGLEAVNLGKSFKRRPVLRGISLAVQRGEAVGLLGPNGAGKTTCFYLVTGLLSPIPAGSPWTVRISPTCRCTAGRALESVTCRRKPRSSAASRWSRTSAACSRSPNPTASEREGRCSKSLMAEFSITHLRRTPAMALSGGERRRVEIARALASQPSFHPAGRAAGRYRSRLRSVTFAIWCKHLKDRGIGVLITDHNVRETLEIVDRAYIIHEGVVLMEGKPSEIVSHEDVRRVYLGETV